MTVYLDYAATSPVDEIFMEFINNNYKNLYGNPASNHILGFEAKQTINDSKDIILKSLNLSNKNYDFILTSGSTESINTVFYAFNEKYKDSILNVGCDTDHKAILNTFKSKNYNNFILHIKDLLNNEDLLNQELDRLSNCITPNIKVILFNFTTVNNETGDIISGDVVSTIKDYINNKYPDVGILIHLDHTQGMIKTNYKLEIADFISFSGHKIGTFKGIGGLIYNKKYKNILKEYPMITGGGQQDNIRSGTENALFIGGLAQLINTKYITMISSINVSALIYNKAITSLQKIADTYNIKLYINQTNNHSNYIINCSFEGIEGESILSAVGLLNDCISTTSACNSSTLEPSYVLTNMGYNKSIANCAFRISYNDTDKQSVDNLLNFIDNDLNKVIQHLARIRVRILNED